MAKGKASSSKKAATVAAPISNRAMEAKWRAESDMRTLRDAQMIQGDTSRMRAATALAKKEMAALATVAKKAP